ncbi:SGNH/GDSL hydrolase family protein [Tichowtungia aerotolerans]|uniref:SGNH hydrolase-type esterase domain-containing protein n=1 Tax=Tichowtungia aerotolerans TaxID=2697043 RepID=A0A6P1M3B3_9BACT|nr:SGNH/GDSL hydrolase family protein [Tichowtungia aerotolerans]QHI69100.1 hypothetical protein GT409_06450 [Tichowtungia aerotolerans]
MITRMGTKVCAVALLILSSASVVRGVLIASDNFDYMLGTVIASGGTLGNAGESGFLNEWKFSAHSGEVVENLNFPGVESSGNALKIIRNNSGSLFRGMRAPLTGAYYVGMIFVRNDIDNGGGENWRLELRHSAGYAGIEASSVKYQIGSSSTELAEVKAAGATASSYGTKAYGIGSPVYVLAKVEMSDSGPDTVSMKWYDVFDEFPAKESGIVWDAVSSGEFAPGAGWKLILPSHIDEMIIDEFRVGTEFADVISGGKPGESSSDLSEQQVDSGRCLIAAAEAGRWLKGDAPQFEAGQRVCFLGDSITHYGHWWTYVWSYYISRFPECPLVFVNAGIAGDTAGDGLKRWPAVLQAARPNLVCVMFGMNDMDRSAYRGEGAPGVQEKSLHQYEASMDSLLACIKGQGLPTIAVTSSPYDGRMRAPGVSNGIERGNEGLARAVTIVERAADRYGASVIDLHTPMTAIQDALQKKDPARTIIGRDRVHPESEGSWIMAWNFLAAQHVPAEVAAFVLDYKAGKIKETVNCQSSAVKVDHDGIIISYKPEVLPLPVFDGYRAADTVVPLTDTLNREVIQVQNLPVGNYRLILNGKEVGTCSDKVLHEGLNISTLPSNPNQKIASEMMKLLMEYVALCRAKQEITYMNLQRLIPVGMDVDDVSAARDYFTNVYKPHHGGDRKRVEAYLKWRGREEQLQREADSMLASVYASARPVPVEIIICAE